MTTEQSPKHEMHGTLQTQKNNVQNAGPTQSVGKARGSTTSSSTARSVGDTGTHLEVFINDEAEFTEWAVRFGFMALDATAVPFDS